MTKVWNGDVEQIEGWLDSLGIEVDYEVREDGALEVDGVGIVDVGDALKFDDSELQLELADLA